MAPCSRVELDQNRFLRQHRPLSLPQKGSCHLCQRALGGLGRSPRQAVPLSISSSLSGRRACQGCLGLSTNRLWSLGLQPRQGRFGQPCWISRAISQATQVAPGCCYLWGPGCNPNWGPSKSLFCSGVSFWSPLTGGDLQSLPAKVPGGGLVQERRACPPQAAFPSVERRTVPLGDLLGALAGQPL